jgi:phosphoribosylanthranilate isomerase
MRPFSRSPIHSFTRHPQVKICGITSPEDAVRCVGAGADALGLVFWPQSTRAVSPALAAEIAQAVPASFPLVGVFVDAAEVEIRQTVERVGLAAVQLHGRENTFLVADLRRSGLLVIKALFTGREPGVDAARDYLASAFLVEAGRSQQPGGTGREWNWEVPDGFYRGAPLILAGGLAPANVAAAVRAVRPDAVDVSSGVESAPGRKDRKLVRAFVDAVRGCPVEINPRRIF